MPAMRVWTWEDVMPRVRDAWMAHHAQVCHAPYDWRLAWPAVREGWRKAGGAVAPLVPEDVNGREAQVVVSREEWVLPMPGTHMFDAFGEPAGRVKALR